MTEDPVTASLQLFSSLYLALYIGAMVLFGAIGMRRIRGGDDFATARHGYGPLFLALAFTATVASGATFLGLPGFAYTVGLPSLYMMVYPIGVFTGVLICIRLVTRAGEEFGNRSIPEFLGDRYQSDFLRIMVALFSLLLLFYLAGQLVSGLLMFERMLGLSAGWALVITSVVLLVYVVIGGAHADILTDGLQGGVMLVIAISVGALAFFGFEAGGSWFSLIDRLGEADPSAVATLSPTHPLFDSWWDVVAIAIAHIPLGMLPHIGNKLWALRDPASQRNFVLFIFGFGLLLPMMMLGGLLARVVIGDALFEPGATNNEAIPALFIALFPPWLAALLGVAILAAVMSTADGLLISSSQIFANDIYRRTIAPRWHPHTSNEVLDRRVLNISRVATLAVLVSASALAWFMRDTNTVLIIWVGLGGMMAATAGPLLLGALWSGVTRTGALSGFMVGAALFVIAKAGLVPAGLLSATPFAAAPIWLANQAPNPFSCSTLGILGGVLVTWLVSLTTRPLGRAYLDQLFGNQAATKANSQLAN